MTEKPHVNQELVRRKPRQERSQQKVELMLEAAILLLERGNVAGLTTNAVAAKAGVSIGTLYQYFDDKHALLDALVARELGAISAEVIASLRGAPPGGPGQRIRLIVRAVTGAYGGRPHVHRQLMEYALTFAPHRQLSPLYTHLTQLLTTEGLQPAVGPVHKLTAAQAFVLTHAVAGVLRTLAADSEAPPTQEVEDALVQLVLGFWEVKPFAVANASASPRTSSAT